jgi:hypothetical protein
MSEVPEGVGGRDSDEETCTSVLGSLYCLSARHVLTELREANNEQGSQRGPIPSWVEERAGRLNDGRFNGETTKIAERSTTPAARDLHDSPLVDRTVDRCA